jgi:hypothetical protein
MNSTQFITQKIKPWEESDWNIVIRVRNKINKCINLFLLLSTKKYANGITDNMPSNALAKFAFPRVSLMPELLFEYSNRSKPLD